MAQKYSIVALASTDALDRALRQVIETLGLFSIL
jgi:hypothetical protein